MKSFLQTVGVSGRILIYRQQEVSSWYARHNAIHVAIKIGLGEVQRLHQIGRRQRAEDDVKYLVSWFLGDDTFFEKYPTLFLIRVHQGGE